jgi:hypothetical protein
VFQFDAYAALRPKTPSPTSTGHHSSQTSDNGQKDPFGVVFMEDAIDTDLDNDDEEEDPRVELDRYLKGPREKGISNLLDWWKVHPNHYRYTLLTCWIG